MSLFPLDRLMSRVVTRGRLTVINADGARYDFGDPALGASVTIRIIDPKFRWKMALHPSVHLGDAYVAGGFVIEEGDIRTLLDLLLGNLETMPEGFLDRFAQRVRSVWRLKDVTNGITRSSRNVRHHYDISQDLYDLFLDEDLQYSCAYWTSDDLTIEEAQLAKRRHIGKKLLIEPGMTVLDIGCGWGGLGLHLAKEHGAKVTGVTLSEDQLARARQRAEEQGLTDRVSFELRDYRHETRTFDRIVSVGMFEHVGRPHFAEFFRHLDRLLKPDGVAMIHTIAKMWSPSPINTWIRRNIFPGAYLPALSELAPAFQKPGFWMTDLEVWRLHYAKTLRAWDDRFQQHRDKVAEMFDEEFCRMWEYYLTSCEAGFVHSGLAVFQMQFAKKIGTVPLTRDYLYPSDTKATLVQDAAVARPRLEKPATAPKPRTKRAPAKKTAQA